MNVPSLKPVVDEVKTDEVKTDEVKTDEVKTDEVKTDEVKTDEVKTDEVKQDEVKADTTPDGLPLDVTDTVAEVPSIKTIGKAIDRLQGNITADQESSLIALSHSLVGESKNTPLLPAEMNPSNWNILASPLGISARNSTTGRIFNGHASEFNKLIRGE